MADLIFIVIITLLAAQADLFKENISVVAGRPALRLITVLAVIALAIYLFMDYRPLVKKMDHKKAKYFLCFSLISMIIGMLFPYYKFTHPIISSLHLILTLLSVMSLICFQLVLLAEQRIKNDRQFIRNSRTMLVFMGIIAMVILTFNAINGLSEIIMLIDLLLFVRMNR